ncbi:Glucanosyltransferase-domain-containing protein [Aspergillus carlsbadensis]|nr:Glucanosyltransferase-domain-containing protein [Aspergillus carlsbadensis]
MLWNLLLGCLVTATVVLAETKRIVIQGSKFLGSSTSEQFILKGLHYSPITSDDDTSNDPLANPTACKRDIPHLKSLGINTISVYTVDATQDHDKCMNLLADAGIYVIPYLNPLAGLETGNVTWTTEDFSAQTAIVDAFAGYENVLAFFFQVDSSPAVQRAAGDRNATEGIALFDAYAKSVVRDVKAYIASEPIRNVPVGYATRVTELIDDEINHFTCGQPEERVDILGIRSESWCDGSTAESSGWGDLSSQLWFPSVPVVMAEFYCADPEDRDEGLGDVAALYGGDMGGDWSGGVFYTYSGSDYGLVEINGDKVTETPAFDKFASILSSLDPLLTNASSSPSYYTTCNYRTPFPAQPPQPDPQFCSCTLLNSLCTPSSNTSSILDTLWTDICSTSTDLCRRRPNDNYAGEYGRYSMCNATVEISAILSKHTVDVLGTGSETCTRMWGENVVFNPLYGSWANGRGPRTCVHTPIGGGRSRGDGSDEVGQGFSGAPRTSVLFIVLVVLAGVLVIALIAITVCCVRRRRRRRRAQAAAAAGTAAGPGSAALVSEVAQGKQAERPDLQSDFAETAEGSSSVPMATGGLGGGSATATATATASGSGNRNGNGRATTLMPMEFFAPGPGEGRTAR